MTMTAVAAELGLSRKTVSVVLNGHARRFRVSDATVKRVREHLARRGYVPSRQARDLRAAPPRVIGLLHPGSLAGHMVDALHRLVEALSSSAPGFEVMVTPELRVEEAVRELLARRVTDLIWMHNAQVAEEFREPRLAGYLARMRTVIYNYRFDSPLGETELLERNIRLVGVNRTVHKRRLALFLRRLGHRTIGFPDVDVPGPPGHSDVFVRAGFTAARCPPPFDAEKLMRAMREQGVTAAFFNGDPRACQAIDALQRRGVRIPEELTVTGFDGTSLPFGSNLTTLAMPVAEMVARTCAIATGETDELRHGFEMELVKGRTHGPPRPLARRDRFYRRASTSDAPTARTNQKQK